VYYDVEVAESVRDEVYATRPDCITARITEGVGQKEYYQLLYKL